MFQRPVPIPREAITAIPSVGTVRRSRIRVLEAMMLDFPGIRESAYYGYDPSCQPPKIDLGPPRSRPRIRLIARLTATSHFQRSPAPVPPPHMTLAHPYHNFRSAMHHATLYPSVHLAPTYFVVKSQSISRGPQVLTRYPLRNPRPSWPRQYCTMGNECILVNRPTH